VWVLVVLLAALAVPQVASAQGRVLLMQDSEGRAPYAEALRAELAPKGIEVVEAAPPSGQTVLQRAADAQGKAARQGVSAAIWVEQGNQPWAVARVVTSESENVHRVPLPGPWENLEPRVFGVVTAHGVTEALRADGIAVEDSSAAGDAGTPSGADGGVPPAPGSPGAAEGAAGPDDGIPPAPGAESDSDAEASQGAEAPPEPTEPRSEGGSAGSQLTPPKGEQATPPGYEPADPDPSPPRPPRSAEPSPPPGEVPEPPGVQGQAPPGSPSQGTSPGKSRASVQTGREYPPPKDEGRRSPWRYPQIPRDEWRLLIGPVIGVSPRVNEAGFYDAPEDIYGLRAMVATYLVDFLRVGFVGSVGASPGYGPYGTLGGSLMYTNVKSLFRFGAGINVSAIVASDEDDGDQFGWVGVEIFPAIELGWEVNDQWGIVVTGGFTATKPGDEDLITGAQLALEAEIGL
jgi:hypothetical protein